MSCLHYSGRKSIALIRINGHLVQCRPLVHSLEALYTQHARCKPFVFLVRPLLFGESSIAGCPAPCRDHALCCCHTYLYALMLSTQSACNVLLQDIAIPGDQVDVNVHPTKHEVIFLHQDGIIAAITDEVERLHQGPVRSACFHHVDNPRAGGAKHVLWDRGGPLRSNTLELPRTGAPALKALFETPQQSRLHSRHPQRFQAEAQLCGLLRLSAQTASRRPWTASLRGRLAQGAVPPLLQRLSWQSLASERRRSMPCCHR